jgi:hypothetical protein
MLDLAGGGFGPDYLFSMCEVRPGKVQECRSSLVPEADMIAQQGRRYKEEIAAGRMTVTNGEWMGATCRVAAVNEPLKTRLITAGPTWGQYLSMPVQQKMWDYMQKVPSLALTGRSMDLSDITTLIGRSRKISNSGWKFVSGDFSAATDNLHMDISALLLDMVLERISDPKDKTELKEIAESVLLSQMIKTELEFGGYVFNGPMDLKGVDDAYPLRLRIDGTDCFRLDTQKGSLFMDTLLEMGPSVSKLMRVIEDKVIYCPIEFLMGNSEQMYPKFELYFPQLNGQLMGSVLSFPILCYANLIAYWISLEEYLGEKIDLLDLPVLVNGDDILFMADEGFYEIWKQRVSSIGFTLSVGKNYFSDKYCMVNSQLYKLLKDTSGMIVDATYVPFLNCGLLTGQAKVTERASMLPKTLDGFYNGVMRGCHDRLRIHKRFLHYNKKEVGLESRDGLFNMFLDPHFGGLGFHLYPEVRSGVQWYVTPFQQKFAAFLYRKFLAPQDRSRSSWLATLVDSAKDEKRLSLQKKERLVRLRYENTCGPLQKGEEEYLNDLRVIPLVNDTSKELDLPETPSFRALPHSLWREFTRSEEDTTHLWEQGILTIGSILATPFSRFIDITRNRKHQEHLEELQVEEFLAGLWSTPRVKSKKLDVFRGIWRTITAQFCHCEKDHIDLESLNPWDSLEKLYSRHQEPDKTPLIRKDKEILLPEKGKEKVIPDLIQETDPIPSRGCDETGAGCSFWR